MFKAFELNWYRLDPRGDELGTNGSSIFCSRCFFITFCYLQVTEKTWSTYIRPSFCSLSRPRFSSDRLLLQWIVNSWGTSRRKFWAKQRWNDLSTDRRPNHGYRISIQLRVLLNWPYEWPWTRLYAVKCRMNVNCSFLALFHHTCTRKWSRKNDCISARHNMQKKWDHYVVKRRES